MKTITVTLKTTKVSPADFAKRIFYLLYKATDPAGGMGVLQERTRPSEDEVFENICQHGDYSSRPLRRSDGLVSADYVFGRRIKWDLWIKEDAVVSPNYGFNDSQTASDFYPTIEKLFEAVAHSLKIDGLYELNYKPRNSRRNLTLRRRVVEDEEEPEVTVKSR